MFLKITLEDKEYLVPYVFPDLPKATFSFDLDPTPLTSTHPSQGTSCKQQQQILSHSSFPVSKELCKPNKIPSELESEELLLDFASSSSTGVCSSELNKIKFVLKIKGTHIIKDNLSQSLQGSKILKR